MNDGFINESVLREYINNHSYNTYNQNIKSFLRFAFSTKFDPEVPFEAKKRAGQVKPDLCIFHNGAKINVSIKKGSGNSVHQESIDVFFPYIKDTIGSNALNNLKLFHYGDDTTDDTGKIRFSASEAKTRYAKQIANLNNELNVWSNLINFLNRFLFVGNVSTTMVDVIYHGTIESGLWATRDEIISYVKNNHFDMHAVHFGPLTYQVWGRNEKRTAVHPNRRYVMQVKWGTLTKDLERIRRRND